MSTPTLNQFRYASQEAFRFLVEELGFSEQAAPAGEPVTPGIVRKQNGELANLFSVEYRRENLSVTVEGYNWGYAATVILQRVQRERVTFGFVADAERLARGLPSPPHTDQLGDVRRLAEDLKAFGRPLLLGDEEAWRKARRIHDDTVAMNIAESTLRERKSAYHRDVKRANEAFRRGDYQDAIILLSKHQDMLSASERMKLAYAQNHIS